MSYAEEPQGQGQPGTADRPGDVPGQAAGTSVRAAHRSPSVCRTTFDWLDGKFLLVQRFTVEHPAAPSGITVIGVGAVPETFSQHYYDSRGVAPVYQMSLDDGIWKLWREAPGEQRYVGVFAADGTTIDGAWEASADGSNWKHDFRLTYSKIA